MVPRSRRWGRKQLDNRPRDNSVPLKLEKNIIINIFMAILVTTLCEHAYDHDGRRRLTAALWPHSRRQGTLQSANILRKKFTSLNLESIIVIYTIMAMKGHGALCLTSWYLVKSLMLDGGVMAKGPPNWKGASLGCKDSDSKLGGRKKVIGTRYWRIILIGRWFYYINNLVKASKIYAVDSGSEWNRLFLGKKKMAGKKDEAPPTVDLGLGEGSGGNEKTCPRTFLVGT